MLLPLAARYIHRDIGNAESDMVMGTTRKLCAGIALVFLLDAGAAEAQQPVAVCPSAIAPTGELAPWSNPADLAVAVGEQGSASIIPDQSANLALRPTPEVRYVLQPSKPGTSDTFGGVLRFRIITAGTYRIALGAGAWIDVVRDGQSIASTGHGRGPECSGIRKIVDFPLQPGEYTLQLAESPTPRLQILVARQP